MSLEQALHTRWKDSASLSQQLPVSQFFTGLAVGNVRHPYAVWERQESGAGVQTSDRQVHQLQGTLHIWATSLDQARAVSDAFATAFDRQSFPLSAGSVLSFRIAGLRQEVTEHGIWHVQLACQAWTESSW